MRRRHRIVFLLLGLTILVGGCEDISDNAALEIEASDEELAMQAGTWVNFLGLMQTDPGVWRVRLQRACVEGVWNHAIARQLAAEFIEEDLALSVRAEGLGPPSVGEGAQALWIMTVNVCREAFPDGAIDDGPPSL